jgi:hypothetical protein
MSASDATSGAVGMMLLLAFIIGGLVVYILPTIIALVKKKQNTAAIALVNLLLGWSFIGWVVALVWAVTVDPPTAAPVKAVAAPVAPAPALLCSACGKYNPATSRFCAHCGGALGASL